MLTVLASINVLGRRWDLHTEIGGALLSIVGSQVLALGLCAHAYATYFMGEKDAWFDSMRSRFHLEHGLALGGLIMLAGGILGAVIVVHWVQRGFGAISEEQRRDRRGDAPDHRHPGLLLVLPTQHPRPAPTLRCASARWSPRRWRWWRSGS